ncbi:MULTISPECIES: PTS sugar transporter subunit IIA [Streptococcus]|uniref:PTS fructose transporter subunit IIA n=3 Tax=Streptococcus ruminantium TaxID=1917441 RepID=A0A2Z5TUD4_9STRE|nr:MULTISPECIES: PTS sugar transporter subunit IIA [Streptococcus]MDQ8759899.1 PTS sugar transporter subunit IIA [Streptococcus ruminantium]MDQ8765099.1 PTS sugar transporter subunit IIA [Streptococcus ruminantium]MDQ8768981.1 PTS sugar transporter subunit IIA [Streptococcus ruminantium]MDQ8774290.1 PTS sugar transporter subunit IIA [Streptococcus ruminantium]MDQ8779983.1 PTS sugar transporter subunit IIA [Streptococcus ruminantium]
MTKSLVLVSHGLFCEELKKSTEMIMGPQEDIYTVALLPEEGPEDFQRKFEETIARLEEFVVFADLLGGTPANVVSRKLLEGEQFDLYAGMNMPMVIGFLNGVLLGESVDYVDFGTSNLIHVNSLLMTSDEEE